MNYKLLIQYDGTDFHGWQVQAGDRTIQGELERVIGTLDNGPVKVFGSGRTDAGVHAEGQVASVQMRKTFEPDQLKKAINGNLWRDIRVMNVERVPDDFHARFSAISKTYVYRIMNAPVMSPFWRRFAHHEGKPLDIAAMTLASRSMLGEHDWTAFASAQADGDNRVRNITEIAIDSYWDERANGMMIEMRFTANGFLRYMVRSLAGTLIEVGQGKMDSDTIQTAIVSGDRTLVGKTAPAHGLTLAKVYY
ncbi:tRNA pseudouridine(38-40) synthase TruA [Leptolyngbya sp. 7M]|uniref:tRNA pseudouridine(38-40) synthase TruA n=1 Tax=Leptolyngbya sp. 7M TaxID=2812896 RepID=UPI001B8B707D|nr:tRNA pseudouridine(38-40) synthase TruA [Leptolyngbya sp. 7M]QYO65982.1 tRNA pseudouridine(38-40) synthase TruA [Leptolyngbya sp. 7M]